MPDESHTQTLHLPWAEWGLTGTLNLQVADLGHLWSPLPLHRSWVGLLEEEMFQMGDREKQMVISLSWQLCWHRTLQALDEHGTTSSQLPPKCICWHVALPAAQPAHAVLKHNTLSKVCSQAGLHQTELWFLQDLNLTLSSMFAVGC